MQDEKYIDIAIKVFNNIQKQYKLKLVVNGTILNYSNKSCSFSVYLEKHFEFYICFHLDRTDLRLYDIAVWLGFQKDDIALVAKNQFANEHDAKFVLMNLYTVLEKLLDMLQKKPELLVEFLEHQRCEKRSTLSETNLFLIKQAWEAKEFEKFLILVEENRAIIKNSKSAALIFKQETYIKKTSNKTSKGQGDG